jgi:DNA-binding MarR family transcriptional regulator
MSKLEQQSFDFREFTFELIRHQQAIAEKLGLNLTDFKALGLLHRRGDMTPKCLAEAMGMSAAATTTIIDRLEKARYVERKRGGGDRRSLNVHALEGSEKKVERLYKSLRDLTETLVASYSEKDLKVIANYLSTATKTFREATATLQSS